MEWCKQSETIIAVVTIFCLHLVGAVKTLKTFRDIDMGLLKCLLKRLRNVAIDLEKRLLSHDTN